MRLFLGVEPVEQVENTESYAGLQPVVAERNFNGTRDLEIQRSEAREPLGVSWTDEFAFLVDE